MSDGKDSAKDEECSKKEWLKAQSHKVNSSHLETLLEGNTVEEVTFGNYEIKYLSMSSAVERIKNASDSTSIAPITNDTDLVPAVYEGGLKIWECSWDLIKYMADSNMDFKGCRVLELGCGAGLPSILAMLRGAHVTLQDYNKEVIDFVTIPNIVLNAVNLSVLTGANPDTYKEVINDVISKSSFYSGDWEDFGNLFTNEANSGEILTGDKCQQTLDNVEKFDLILTCETIYNAECHDKLLSLMTNHLKENGKIWLAAKSYYFGVGGGILQFCDLVKKRGQLDIRNIFTNEIGVKREILELKFKSNDECRGAEAQT